MRLFLIIVGLGVAAVLGLVAQFLIIAYDVILVAVLKGFATLVADAAVQPRRPSKLELVDAYRASLFMTKRMGPMWILSLLTMAGTVVYGLFALLDSGRHFTMGNALE